MKRGGARDWENEREGKRKVEKGRMIEGMREIK